MLQSLVLKEKGNKQRKWSSN